MEASNPAKSVPAGFSSQYPQTKRPDALKRPVSLLAGAAGSSAPHAYGTGALRMSDIAAIKKESDVAVGNIIGSNIFNILGILGVSAMITPLSSSGLTGLDLGVMTAFALALWGFAATGPSHHAHRRTAHARRLLGPRVLASREDLGSSRCLWREMADDFRTSPDNRAEESQGEEKSDPRGD